MNPRGSQANIEQVNTEQGTRNDEVFTPSSVPCSLFRVHLFTSPCSVFIILKGYKKHRLFSRIWSTRHRFLYRFFPYIWLTGLSRLIPHRTFVTSAFSNTFILIAFHEH